MACGRFLLMIFWPFMKLEEQIECFSPKYVTMGTFIE